ncbi:MAG: PDZ domain-containing protein [Pirellulales bacterium]
MDNDGLQTLQATLPRTVIDRRNGGLLGISGDRGLTDACMVTTVQPNSAAAVAGIEPDDQIVSLDGKKVESFSELTQTIAEKSGGDKVAVTVKRGEQTLEKQVVLGEWKPEHLRTNAIGQQMMIQNGQQIILQQGGGQIILGR